MMCAVELENKMINSLKKIVVGLVGATFLIGAMAPVSAAPVLPTAQIAGSDNVHQVRDDRWRRHGNGNWNGHRPGNRPGWNGGRQVIVRAGMAIIARVQAIGMVTVAIIITAMAIVAIMMGGGTLWQRLVQARL